MSSPDYSIVIPVYNNEASLSAVIERLERISHAIDGTLEGVFVVDGSPDASALVLERLLPSASFASQLVVLSRNYGAFAAVRAGMAAAGGRAVAVMAADMQEPEDLYLRFHAALVEGPAFIALGRRESRADPGLQSLLARSYWSLYRRLVVPEIPAGGVDVFAARREVVDELVRLHESHTSLIGLLYMVGFPRVELSYHRAERHEGRSSWSWRKRIRYLLDSIFSFTDLPIIAITAVGFVGSVGSILVAAVVLIGWLAGRIQVPGYTPLMFAIAIMTSLVLFSLGIVGSYIWRTYENSKQRPRWIPMSHASFEGASAMHPADDFVGITSDE